jgi:SAM-dependent methyltransferase
MKNYLQKLLASLVCRGSPQAAASRLAAFAAWCVKKHSPREALRFLFLLDAALYRLQGRTAIAYEGGLHPKHRLMRYHDFFTQRIQAGETVLDIGCGIGAVAYSIATKCGAQVTGIDFNRENIELAKENRVHEKIEWLCGDALTELPNRRYDVVVLSNVLEHLEDRVAFLKQVRQTVAPSRWLIRVPLFERDWRTPLKKELDVEWRLDQTHCTEYTQEQFLEECGQAGLEVRELEIRWGEIWSELCPMTV